MKFNTGVITLALGLASQVYGKGYQCVEHYVIGRGDSCDDILDGSDDYYNLRYEDLVAFNPTVDCNNLSIGQKLCIDVDLDNYYDDTYIIKKTDTYEGIAKKLGTTQKILYRINGSSYLYELGEDNIKHQVGNHISYRKDKCYIPDFSKSKEYILSKHRKSTTTKKSTKKTTKKSTKKKSTTKTITKTATKATGKAKQTSYACDKHVVVKHGDTCYKIYTNKNVNISSNQLLKLNPNLNCDNLRSNTKICVSSKNAGNNKTPNFSNSKQVTLK